MAGKLSKIASLCWLAAAADAAAQGSCDRDLIDQPEPPATELVVARLHFGTDGAIRHCGWWHNYPDSDANFNEHIEAWTRVDVDRLSFRIVDLGSPEVFDYPFAYISEPGEMALTDRELENLREYIERGGFILMDDFDGPWQLETMLREIRRAFPDRHFGPMPEEHAAFGIVLALDNLDGMADEVPGGEITYFGLYNSRDELAIAAGHNNDLANFWDWYDDRRYPLEPAADAFRLGINVLIWAMTH